jgi:protein-L-isoaspartate(D-aspartate) O-methyltransferase
MNWRIDDTHRHRGLRNGLIKILIEKGITNQVVLDAINRIPRHLFLDHAFLEHAYEDKAFPIGDGQTISQPYTVAFQTSLLELKKGDKVLEIGTGSGYQCCVLIEMGANVYTIERVKNLHVKAVFYMAQLQYKAHFYCGDGTLGLPNEAPFDKIIVTAGAPVVPETLVQQLSIGGILVIPVGDAKSQKMLRIRRINATQFSREELGDFSFVPLKGEKGW